MAEGVEAALRERPDLVICDMVMPGGGGADVVTRLREEPATAATPVLLVSALPMRARSPPKDSGRAPTASSKSPTTRRGSWPTPPVSSNARSPRATSTSRRSASACSSRASRTTPSS
ncbi:MAG: response regulator [Acidobacteriota bacterium]|nr:response regulator [Acidobacteriota bacterium]